MAWGRLLGLYGTVVPECFLREGSEGDFDDIALVGGDIHQQPAGVGAGEVPQGSEQLPQHLRRDAAIWGMLADGGDGGRAVTPAKHGTAGHKHVGACLLYERGCLRVDAAVHLQLARRIDLQDALVGS